MLRASFVAILAGLALTAAAPAQTPAWRFQWKPGQVLNYQAVQSTAASEVVDGKKTETRSKIQHLKRWRVLGVDAAGVATLEMSLTSLRVETVTPGGESLLFDSNDLDKSNPELRQELTKFVGIPLAVLRIDGQGRVVEVQQSRYGPASRFESEPPFYLTLPSQGPQFGQTWERPYVISLEPPPAPGEHSQGPGQKIPAVQQYLCREIQGCLAAVAVTTILKSLPPSPFDQVPLLQMQPEGEVVFNTQAGRLETAHMRVNKELKNHQGEGSRYLFQNDYAEKYLGGD